MGPNFLECDREQALLLPPSLREGLPGGDLAGVVIDAVERLDLTAFYAAYRLDGQGRAAHEPSMMVALLLYSYAVGERSSRRIERRCVEDVATRVICANRAPDHTTIARFRQRHEDALAELFGEVLWLCAEAGLVRVGVIAVDGTKVQANASHHATRDYEQIAKEILEHADAVDAEEDERFGDARGDELPEQLSTPEGRQRWLRDARRRLDDKRAREARPIPGPRPKRLKEAKRRLEEDHQVQLDANARLRGLPPPRADEERAAAGGAQSAQALATARGAGGQDQPQRSGFAQRQDAARVGAGLQRAGGHHGRSDRHRRRGGRRLPGLRAPRADGQRRPGRARLRRRRRQSRRRTRRRRLLAPGPNATPHGRRSAGPRPARRQQAQRRTPGLAGRALHVHAQSPLNRAGRRALRPAPGHDRARLRPHQVQPPLRPIPQTRQIGLQVGMAAHQRHPQPAEALEARRGAVARLKRDRAIRRRHLPRLASRLTAARRPASSAVSQQPPWIGAVSASWLLFTDAGAGRAPIARRRALAARPRREPARAGALSRVELESESGRDRR